MTQETLRTHCQQRSHEMSVRHDSRVPHGVHASMEAVQVTTFEPSTDLAPRQPEFDQLCQRDHAELRRRDARDGGPQSNRPRIGSATATIDTFWSATNQKVL